MPKIDGARVLADLKRLAEFGRYKTGVHRPTYSPDDVASRHWLADPLRRGRAGCPRSTASATSIGRNHAAKSPPAGRLAQRDPAAWRLARWRARRDLRRWRWRAPSPRTRPAPGSGSTSSPGPTRRGITAQFLGSRSFTGALGEDEIDAAREPRRRHAAARGAGDAPGFAGRPRAAVESGALCRLSRSAYRAGRHARFERTAHRRRRRHRRHPQLSRHLRPASRTTPAPRAWRGARMPAWRWSGSPTRIHDRFPQIAGRARCGRSAASCSTRRAQHRARPRRDAVPVPRHRPGLSRRVRGRRLYELVGEADRAGPCASRSTPMRSRAAADGRRLSGRA